MINVDYKKAIHYYQLAVKQGDPFAQYRLGMMYNNGKGVERNYQKALELFSKAANQDYVKAQYSLGVLFRDGRGTRQNFARAHKWFTIAASRWRDSVAIREKEELEEKMSEKQLEEARSLTNKWLENMKGKNPLGSPFL
jgi:hypothetical protein